jgi:hypothetical protein
MTTPTWKEKEHPPHAQQGNVAVPTPQQSPQIKAQERVGGAVVVAPAQGGAAVGGQVGGQGGGLAAGRAHGAQGGRAAPASWGGPAAPVRGHGGGHAGSGPRFNWAELEHLHEIVERILPLGPDEWEMVTMQHMELYIQCTIRAKPI